MLRSASNCRLPESVGGHEVALGDRAPQVGEPLFVLADVAEQPALLEDGLRVVLNLQLR